MTQEQIELLVSVGDSIRANPRSYSELEDQEKQILESLLIPDSSFDSTQRYFLGKWFLETPDEAQQELTGLWPQGSKYPTRELNGKQYLSSDLLSDALNGRRLTSMLPILETLVLVYIEPEEWPQPETEDEV